MKQIDLTPLNIPRLKAYRKSVLNKLTALTRWVSDSSSGIDKETYDFLCEARDRVNTELARKQTVERNKTLDNQ